MSAIFKYFTAVIFAVASTICSADTFTFNYYYPPGGGTDVWSGPVITGLQARGHSVKQDFYKSCHEAMSKAATQTNAFVLMGTMDISQDAGRCPSLKDYPTFKLVANLSAASYYLCTAPKKTHITLAELTGPDTLKVAMSSGPISVVPFGNLLSNSSPKLNLRIIPYEGLASARAALIAGTDVDLIWLANGVESIVSAGGKCLASSTAKNHYNLPFMGKFAPGKFQDFYATIDMWALGTPSKEHLALLAEVLQSGTFKDFLAQRPSSINLGVAK